MPPIMEYRRVKALAVKEIRHTLRDFRSLAIAFVMPLVMTAVFGAGVSLDVDKVRTVVHDLARNEDSRALVETLANNNDFHIVGTIESYQEALSLFRSSKVSAAVVIPWDYSLSHPRKGQVQLIVDGADGTSAQMVLGTGSAVIAHLAKQSAPVPVGVDTIMLYNSDLRSEVFLVPGIIAYVMSIACVMLTSLTVAREWERGNMEQLFASPVTPLEIVVGKTLPYLALGIVQALMVLTIGVVAFRIPFEGKFLTLAFGALVFLVGMLLQGLLISIVTKNQQLATMGTATTTLLPVMLLSGFLFPVSNMPLTLQLLSYAFPARYFMEILRGVLIKGTGIDTLWPQFVALLVFAAIVFLACKRLFRRVVA